MNIDRICPNCMKDNGGKTVCDFCGWDSTKNNGPDKLPVRFVIRDRYFVGKTLYSDCESIVYLGFDTIENKAVNIKEYFPAGIAIRNPDKTVYVPKEFQFAFNDGLIRFLDINRKFIGFPLLSLPATYAVFEENSTAYSICDTVSGITLKSFLARNSGSLKWEQARPLFLPLIDTVKALHDMSVIHGAISPNTVMVCRDGKLRLLGVPVNNREEGLICDGYSAAEQYNSSVGEVGEYTDVYGICATLFTVLIGTVPPSADSRILSDSLTIPAHFADELPRQVLVSLANGMQVKPENRTADIDTLKNELIYGETKENVRKAQRAEVKRSVPAEETNSGAKKNTGLKYAAIASGITAGLFIILAVVLILTVFKDQIFKKGDLISNDEVVSIPSHDQIGDVDSDALESKILYPVPDLKGKYYAETVNNDEYKHFKIVIKDKEFSDTYARGLICAQSIASGESAEHGTVIELTISLGKKTVDMPDVTGLSQDAAMIELLRAGFLYENIVVEEASDSEAISGIVLRQSPEYKDSVSTEIQVVIYVNTYEDDN